MGGSPTDNPRDLARGGDGRSYDDEATGKDPVPGAFGSAAGAQADALSANNATVGQTSGPGATEDVDAALRKSGPVEPE